MNNHSTVAMRPQHLGWRRIAVVIAALLGIAGATGSVTAYAADSQNEVVIANNSDGTGRFTAEDADNPKEGNEGVGAHTPGQDSGPVNRVVRTYDLASYRVDWDVNEALGENVTLKLTLQGTDADLANVTWALSELEELSGCGTNPTITDGGLTLTCVLGDIPEGTHGTTYPQVRLENGVDGTEWYVNAELVSDNAAAATSTTDGDPYYVSEAPVADWVKGIGGAKPLNGVDTAEGYLVWFPVALNDLSQTEFPAKGSGSLQSKEITFYDHAVGFDNQVTLATQAQIDQVPEISGVPCGTLHPDNSVGYPTTDAAWTCSAPTYDNGYPVIEMKAAPGYSLEPPTTNNNGTPNNTAVVSGQIVFFLPPEFLGAGSDFGPFDNWVLGDPPSTDANQTQTGITVSGSTDVVETGTANNEAGLSFSTSGTDPAPPGKTTSFLHSAWFGRNFTQRANVGGSGSTDDWLSRRLGYGNLPGTTDSPVFWTPMFGRTQGPYNIPPDEYSIFTHPTDDPFTPRVMPWDGQGQVHRGEAITLNLDVHANGLRNIFDEPVHGCMTWNAAQIQLDAMPEYTISYWNKTNSKNFLYDETESPNRGPLANLSIGGNAGIWHRTDQYSVGPAIEPFPQSVLDAAGVRVQFALDPTVQPDDPNQQDPTYTGESGGNVAEYGAVDENSVECNNTNPSGQARDWVDHDQVVAGADGLYRYNMVRVIMEGDEFPWWNVNQDLDPAGNYRDGSAFSLTVQGRVGTDYAGNPTDVNHDYKALYLNSARGWGELDANGRPSLTNGAADAVAGCRSLAGSTDAFELEADPDDTDPDNIAPADGNGWCNQRYNPAFEPNSAPNDVTNPTGSYKSTLDNRSFTSRQSTYWFHDSDHDRVTIVAVAPKLVKYNPAGPTQIIDNNEQTTFNFEVSAVGSTTEALTNYTFVDDFPNWATYDDNGETKTRLLNNYYFVDFAKQPSETPGATCEAFPANEEDDLAPPGVTRVRCRFSQEDPANPDGSDLPVGLEGGWNDNFAITVELKGGVAGTTRNEEQENIAQVTSTGTVTWNPDSGTPAEGAAFVEFEQDSSDSAATYMPLASDRAAFQKLLEGGIGPCVNGPDGEPLDGTELEEWQARCIMTTLDEDPSNFDADPPTLDTSTERTGPVSFGLEYTNEGNTNLTNLRFVDVLPWVGDAVEPGSNSGANGADPSTIGDGRSPASSFVGDVGLQSVEGAHAYYVTADDPATVSRDPDKAFPENVWCTWDEVSATGTNVPGTAPGACPTNPYDITAVFVQVTDPGNVDVDPDAKPEAIAPGGVKKVTLTIDTENAACNSLYTNTYGARVDQIELPIRSNDVSAMVECVKYNLGNQVWFDTNNDGLIGSVEDEPRISGVTMLLFDVVDGAPEDKNGDGAITADDAIATTVTDEDGLYLFDMLDIGDYIVGVAASNWADGGPLYSHVSSDPTETDPNDDVDNNDNGFPAYGMVVSGVVTLGNEAEPVGEDPSNNDNDVTPDNRSNLTDDFGFYVPQFDLALRKLLADGQSRTVELGELATFTIMVFNQGDVIGDDVTVIDYLPEGLELADEDWTAGDNNTATIAVPGPIAPGESVAVDITTKVVNVESLKGLENYAEISEQTPVDADGNTIETPIGTPISDIDSIPDTTNDDILINDEILLTPETGDEDDHDIEGLTPADNPPPSTTTPPSSTTTTSTTTTTSSTTTTSTTTTTTKPTTTTTTKPTTTTTTLPRSGLTGAARTLALGGLLLAVGVPLAIVGRRRRRYTL